VNGSTPIELEDVIVLAIDERGTTINTVVAITEQEFQKSHPLLGISNAIFFQKVP
jgi:hypothetical protein